jgi:hypothetical protein
LARKSPAAEPDTDTVDDPDREERRRSDQQQPHAIGRAEHDRGEPGSVAERCTQQKGQRGRQVHGAKSCHLHEYDRSGVGLTRARQGNFADASDHRDVRCVLDFIKRTAARWPCELLAV